MRPSVPWVVVLFVLFAGCTSGDGADPSPTTPSASPLPPRQVLFKENEQACPEAFQGASWAFVVEEGYGRILIEFHNSGAGQLGLKIRDAGGKDVFAVPIGPVSSEPCAHAHGGDARAADVAPGAYRAILEGQGLLGYHVVIVETSPESNGTAQHH